MVASRLAGTPADERGKWDREAGDIRREEAALADDEGNEDLVVGRNLAHSLGEGIVLHLAQGVELLFIADGDGGHTAGVGDRDCRVAHVCELGGEECMIRDWCRSARFFFRARG